MKRNNSRCNKSERYQAKDDKDENKNVKSNKQEI